MSDTRIINVASVPKRSPFRYPGGKTWLVPKARTWIRSLPFKPKLFIEPFAGGGIISLTVASERLADHVIMCELDPDVAAVWRFATSPNYKQLIEEILRFEVSEANVKEVLAGDSAKDFDIAFRTIVKNRMFHGGILAPGSSLMKSGENGKGLSSRWYAKTLATRLEAIADISDRITFIEADGIKLMADHKDDDTTATFIDPPYTAAGKKAGSRLYRYNELDHPGLFSVAKSLAGDFLMTYDNAAGVKELALEHGLDTEEISMKNTHHAKMTELLIGRDLTWARCENQSSKQLHLGFD